MFTKLKNAVLVALLFAASAVAQFSGLEWQEQPGGYIYYIETIVEIEITPLPRGDYIQFFYIGSDNNLYYDELEPDDYIWYNTYEV